MIDLGAVRREFRDYVTQAINRVFVWTTVANTTALGDSDNVTTGDDDPSNGQRPVRRLEPFGFRSRPPAKQRCLSLRLGSSTVIFLGIASDGGYGPGDLNDGETAVYSKAAPKALFADQDGNVAVAAASGKVSSIGGDDYAMPKWSDGALPIDGGFVGSFLRFLASLSNAVDPSVAAAASNMISAMSTGGNFASTKAKNG